MRFARTLVTIFCVALLVAIAITPAASGLLFAILIPLWFFVALTLSLALPVEDKCEPQFFFFLSSASLRAPPLQ